MFIGGASGSTAGGVKVNTFGVLIATVWSSIRGREQTEVFGREIAQAQVRRALAIGALGLVWIHVSTLALGLLEEAPFIDVFFVMMVK